MSEITLASIFRLVALGLWNSPSTTTVSVEGLVSMTKIWFQEIWFQQVVGFRKKLQGLVWFLCPSPSASWVRSSCTAEWWSCSWMTEKLDNMLSLALPMGLLVPGICDVRFKGWLAIKLRFNYTRANMVDVCNSWTEKLERQSNCHTNLKHRLFTWSGVHHECSAPRKASNVDIEAMGHQSPTLNARILIKTRNWNAVPGWGIWGQGKRLCF